MKRRIFVVRGTVLIVVKGVSEDIKTPRANLCPSKTGENGSNSTRATLPKLGNPTKSFKRAGWGGRGVRGQQRPSLEGTVYHDSFEILKSGLLLIFRGKWNLGHGRHGESAEEKQ